MRLSGVRKSLIGSRPKVIKRPVVTGDYWPFLLFVKEDSYVCGKAH